MTETSTNTPAMVYHLFPLGLCGGLGNGGDRHPRNLADLDPWIDHAASLGCDTILLGPVFESASHGYDTVDPTLVDARLGTNADLTAFVAACHARGVRVLLDAVFNHLGRASAAFETLRAEGGRGSMASWFSGVRPGDNPFGDGFDYDTWAGHYALPRLDTENPAVREWWAAVVRGWFAEFGIDGLRLDAADCLSPDFVRFITAVVRRGRPDAWLVGEVVHGDYAARMGSGLLDSTTNYELYKALWSSVKDFNCFELAWSLNRLFGPQGLYRGHSLLTFVDNHDVARLSSVLDEPWAVHLVWALQFVVPGVPSVYYGSEFGVAGAKEAASDAGLRPALALETLGRAGPFRDLPALIRRLAGLRRSSPALRQGDYEQLVVENGALAFRRWTPEEEVVVCINLAEAPRAMQRDSGALSGRWQDLWDGSLCEGSALAAVIPGRWLRVLRRTSP